ncbi:hypothetical protein CBR_g30194 [Chara braunii]|uniref:Choline transporter-like protein n=1 Tax=Chara braunii TaxID=69332 RepID=A0A388LCA1_CHABU|nr:hypothetical protein CBR_g30194 [Chara braunii]|eukprot:GBG79930.1 hypothetical protein CBR_g30194 [Chara braunii]
MLITRLPVGFARGPTGGRRRGADRENVPRDRKAVQAKGAGFARISPVKVAQIGGNLQQQQVHHPPQRDRHAAIANREGASSPVDVDVPSQGVVPVAAPEVAAAFPRPVEARTCRDPIWLGMFVIHLLVVGYFLYTCHLPQNSEGEVLRANDIDLRNKWGAIHSLGGVNEDNDDTSDDDNDDDDNNGDKTGEGYNDGDNKSLESLKSPQNGDGDHDHDDDDDDDNDDNGPQNGDGDHDDDAEDDVEDNGHMSRWNHRTGDEETEDANAANTDEDGVHWWLVTLFAVSLFWTGAVFANIMHVMVAGVVALAVVHSADDRVPMPRYPTLSSLRHALTTSLGSICLGSLFTAAFRVLRWAVRSVRARTGKNECCNCCLACLFGFVEGFVRFFNKYAYVQAALDGKPFNKAARDAWERFQMTGVEALIAYDVTGAVLVMMIMLGGLITGTCAGLWTYYMRQDRAIMVALTSMLMGTMLVGLALVVVESAITCLYVCYAVDPTIVARWDPEFAIELERLLRQRMEHRSGRNVEAPKPSLGQIMSPRAVSEPSYGNEAVAGAPMPRICDCLKTMFCGQLGNGVWLSMGLASFLVTVYMMCVVLENTMAGRAPSSPSTWTYTTPIIVRAEDPQAVPNSRSLHHRQLGDGIWLSMGLASFLIIVNMMCLVLENTIAGRAPPSPSTWTYTTPITVRAEDPQAVPNSRSSVTVSLAMAYGCPWVWPPSLS